MDKIDHNLTTTKHNRAETTWGLFGMFPTHLFVSRTLATPLYDAIYVYRQVSNIRRTLVGNTIVDHSDVVGALPIGTAPTTSSFST